MKRLGFVVPLLNRELLDAELTAVAARVYRGFSTSENETGLTVAVNVLEGASEAELAAITQVVLGHDAAGRTARQQREKERQDDLAFARANWAEVVIDPEVYKADPQLYALAIQLAWLRAEVVAAHKL